MNNIFKEDESPKTSQPSPAVSDIAYLKLSGEEEKPGGDSWTANDYEPPAEPMSLAETIRNSGLAYAAALTLFASVVFMLLIGWFLDLLAGSSPYGVVGGIIIGAVVGFVQFFRITSQIFKK